MKCLSLAGLLMFTVLAGCSDAPEEASSPTSAQCLEQGLILNATAGACQVAPFAVEDFEDPNHHCVVTQQADRVHAPDLVGNPWVLGQSWTFSLAVDGDNLGGTRLIYYADQDFDGSGTALHYMVGTPTREEALRHAMFGENPMIGRVHRVLYSPHESGDHADMFHFPLCDGSSWTTVFYGETFTLSARNVSLETPSGTDAGFLIEGTSTAGSTLRLSYSPTVQWFTFIDLDRADGSTVDLQLTRTETGYRGDAYFLRGQNDETVTLATTNPAPNAGVAMESATIQRADGGDGPYDTIGLNARVDLFGAGIARLTVTAPDGSVAWQEMLDGVDGTVSGATTIEMPYQAGDWTVELNAVGAGATIGAASAQVTLVSIYDRSGSI